MMYYLFMRNVISTTFSQQILSIRLLLVGKKIILVVGSYYNQQQFIIYDLLWKYCGCSISLYLFM